MCQFVPSTGLARARCPGVWFGKPKVRGDRVVEQVRILGYDSNRVMQRLQGDVADVLVTQAHRTR